jgi:hypothetical protein
MLATTTEVVVNDLSSVLESEFSFILIKTMSAEIAFHSTTDVYKRLHKFLSDKQITYAEDVSYREL